MPSVGLATGPRCAGAIRGPGHPTRRRGRFGVRTPVVRALLLAAPLWGLGLGPGLEAQGEALEARLEHLRSEAGIPGLQAALVSRGEIVWDVAQGVADAETGARVTPETVFEAASLTKPVVAWTALRLVERGSLDLDTPLWTWLPYPRLEGDERARDITARHVLSHTTGLPNWGGDPLEMNRAPGERWGYSGEGFVYLGRVLELVSGMPLADLVRREVFEPLGMTSSSLVWRPAYDRLAARGHDVASQPVPKSKPEEGNPAASLHTTALDYARFLGAVLDGEGLDGRTVVSMLSPISQVEGWGGDDHARHLQWGLGWGIQNGERSNAIWHWGDNGTFRCFVIAYPSQGRGLVYFTNSQNGLSIADDLVSRFFEDSHHAIRWLDYPAWDDPRQRSRIALRRSFLESREAGMARLGELHESAPETVDGEELGDLAEYLADRDRFPSAVAVAEARLGWEAVPESALGLAEVLTAADRHAEALEAYERALAMDPKRRDDVEPRLAWLRAGLAARRAPVRLEEDELRRYAGDYGPRHVRLGDGRLVYAREGSTESTPLFPLTRELFAVAGSGDFRLRFVLDGSGRPVSLIGSYADGSEDETPRDP